MTDTDKSKIRLQALEEFLWERLRILPEDIDDDGNIITGSASARQLARLQGRVSPTPPEPVVIRERVTEHLGEDELVLDVSEPSWKHPFGIGRRGRTN